MLTSFIVIVVVTYNALTLHDFLLFSVKIRSSKRYGGNSLPKVFPTRNTQQQSTISSFLGELHKFSQIDTMSILLSVPAKVQMTAVHCYLDCLSLGRLEIAACCAERREFLKLLANKEFETQPHYLSIPFIKFIFRHKMVMKSMRFVQIDEYLMHENFPKTFEMLSALPQYTNPERHATSIFEFVEHVTVDFRDPRKLADVVYMLSNCCTHLRSIDIKLRGGNNAKQILNIINEVIKATLMFDINNLIDRNRNSLEKIVIMLRHDMGSFRDSYTALLGCKRVKHLEFDLMAAFNLETMIHLLYGLRHTIQVHINKLCFVVTICIYIMLLFVGSKYSHTKQKIDVSHKQRKKIFSRCS